MKVEVSCVLTMDGRLAARLAAVGQQQHAAAALAAGCSRCMKREAVYLRTECST